LGVCESEGPYPIQILSLDAGRQIFHNFICPHTDLKGKTPTEVAEIKIEGENPWITIIQNAKVAQRRQIAKVES